MPKKISRINSVDLQVTGADQQNLTITAVGEVPTGGWANGTLVQYEYVTFPEDGIQEYDFIATPPSGGAITVVSPILAAAVQDKPKQLRGVKVYAAQNDLTVRFVTKIGMQERPPRGDDFGVQSAAIVNGQLVVRVRYTGGIQKHFFELYWDGSYMESMPPQVNMRLVHHANGDTGEAIRTETLVFDLLDLDPSVIHLSTAFGYSTDLDYLLGSLRGRSLPFLRGNKTLQILRGDKLLALATELAADEKKLTSFRAGPEAALKSGGLEKELAVLRAAASRGGVILHVMQGYTGVMAGAPNAQNPNNGYSGSLKALSIILEGAGIPVEAQGGIIIVLGIETHG